MIGGFLGAGKTTTIGRLAKDYQSQGLRVVIVTNDQATDLVDTLLLRAQGFDVGEVAGSCFCCNFNELTRTIESLSTDMRPDVVIAEPVGSCTDLVATVLRPLEQLYQVPFEIAPYGVIIKPSHGFKILGGNERGGFSAQAEYIFRKQLEEADFVLLNRVDELSPTRIDEIECLLQQNVPGRVVLRTSAKTGEGFAALRDYLDQPGVARERDMEVDYDVYAAGEAELGWLNCQAVLESQQAMELDEVLLSLVQRLQQRFVASDNEIAHLKVIGTGGAAQSVVNVVSNAQQPTLSLTSNATSNTLDMVINARVAIAPEFLTAALKESLQQIANSRQAALTISELKSFRPGRPVPTHRLVAN